MTLLTMQTPTFIVSNVNGQEQTRQHLLYSLRSCYQCLCALKGLGHTVPLDSKVDDLLELGEDDLKEMLSPSSLEEVCCATRLA